MFTDLFDDFMFWSIVVGVFTFAWMFHHLVYYRWREPDMATQQRNLRKKLEGMAAEMERSGLRLDFEVAEAQGAGDFPNIDDLTVGRFPKHYHGLKLELAWTIIPFFLICWLAWISWEPLDDIWPSAEEMQNYHEVGITGQQWFWSFDCGDLTADICDTSVHDETGLVVLSLKKDESYRLNLTAVDVMHSPYIVQYGLKEDAVPGQYTVIAFTPNESGSFFLDCAEYCGDRHAYMTAIVVIHD